MNIGYIRVSTVEQNEARQLEALNNKFKIDKFFIDKCSGKDTNRPKLQELLDYAREGDTVIVHEFSRLARNTQDLLNLVKTFKEKNITLISNKDNIDTSTPIGEFMLTVIGAINQLERAQTKERQLEGTRIGKKNHKFDKIERDYEKRMKTIKQLKDKKLTKVQASKDLNISRVTLDKYIAEDKKMIMLIEQLKNNEITKEQVEEELIINKKDLEKIIGIYEEIYTR